MKQNIILIKILGCFSFKFSWDYFSIIFWFLLFLIILQIAIVHGPYLNAYPLFRVWTMISCVSSKNKWFHKQISLYCLNSRTKSFVSTRHTNRLVWFRVLRVFLQGTLSKEQKLIIEKNFFYKKIWRAHLWLIRWISLKIRSSMPASK